MKIFRSISLFLLLPLLIAPLYAEARLPLSSSDHTLLQIMIVVLIGILAWMWARWDEICRLREIGRPDLAPDTQDSEETQEKEKITAGQYGEPVGKTIFAKENRIAISTRSRAVNQPQDREAR
jgi:hypothetical protein